VIIKLFVCASLTFLAAATPSVAAEKCRQIKLKADREACYDRQSKAVTEQRQAASANKAKIDPVDQLKIENDKLSKRLRSICRGC
jgi:hypothetical protein